MQDYEYIEKAIKAIGIAFEIDYRELTKKRSKIDIGAMKYALVYLLFLTGDRYRIQAVYNIKVRTIDKYLSQCQSLMNNDNRYALKVNHAKRTMFTNLYKAAA